jgi:choline monooxygenase
MFQAPTHAAYTSGSILQAEREHVFGRSWQYVGNASDLPDSGHVEPITVNGTPVVLTRDAHGTIAALVNVCAHRGSIVCRQSGYAETLTCPYHAWRYALDGELLSAPRSNREVAFEPKNHSLEALSVGRWGPFIFVALSDSIISFDEFLGDLPVLVAEAGIDIDSMRFDRRATSLIDANWKVCAENFLECYHCRVAHPAFSKTIDTSVNGYRLTSHPTFSSQYGPVRPDWTGRFDPTGPIGRSQFHLLYPNTAINIMPGQPNLSIGPINPVSPGSTSRFLDYFFGPNVSPDWIESMIAFDNQVGAEDVVLVESVQEGVAARPHRTSTLFSDSESLIEHFQAYVAAQLASGTSGSV